MHTRCCEEILKGNFSIIPNKNVPNANYLWTLDTMQIETVPAIVEVRFNVDVKPTLGKVYASNGLWDGSIVRNGNPVEVLDFSDIVTAFDLPCDPGFTVQFPGGIGRSITLWNQTDVEMTKGFVSIRKLVDLTAKSESVPNAFGRK